MFSPTPEISIVIVSYNCCKLLLGCLSSIAANVKATHEVIVVDSASNDDTVDAVQREHPEVHLYPCATNVGFVGGNNFGFTQARGTYILMLNPDTLLTEDAVDGMVRFMRRTENCAAIGPRLIGADGNDQHSAQRFPSVGGELKKTLGRLYTGSVPTLEDYHTAVQMGVSFQADWVSGACMLMRADAVKALGALEQRFFMYFEEVDWCKRAADAGWSIWCVPRFSVIHFGSQSALASNEKVSGGNVMRHFQHSRFVYFKKHFGWLPALLVETCHAARACVRFIKSFGCATPDEARKRRETAFAELRGEMNVLLGQAQA